MAVVMSEVVAPVLEDFEAFILDLPATMAGSCGLCDRDLCPRGWSVIVTWLNEGLAMVTAERFAGKPMVRTLQPGAARAADGNQGIDEAARPRSRVTWKRPVALYAVGYWRTRSSRRNAGQGC